MTLRSVDLHIIRAFRNLSIPMARIGLFVVFFWFGILKVFGSSPASPLVQALFERTFPLNISFASFMIMFGLFECLIGVLFLIRGTERVVIPLLVIHLTTTIMPLFALPTTTWSGFMIPTLEGQYIIKNILIVATAIAVASHLHPLHSRKNNQKTR